MRFDSGMLHGEFDRHEIETEYANFNENRDQSIEAHRPGVDIRDIPGTEGFYNAAAWQSNGMTYLLGRKVEKAAEEGKPDVGKLELLTLDPGGNIKSSIVVWKPIAGEALLEDARALPLSDGKIAFGLTSVIEEDGSYIPYPSVLIASSDELQEGILRGPKIIKSMGSGDTATPIDEDRNSYRGKNVTAISPNLFAFRPENGNHQLRVFEYKEDGSVSHQQYINFPKDIAWAEYRIGTTMPPVWINETEAIFPIHGINIVNGRYIYSIGLARLLKSKDGLLSVDNISEKPLIDPDLVAEVLGSYQEELHSERRVVYCCGGIPIFDRSQQLESLKLFVNIGDKRTVEVTIAAHKLTEGWNIDQQPVYERMLSRVA